MSRPNAVPGIGPSLALAAGAAAYVWTSYDYGSASQTMPWIAGVLAIALILIDIAARSEFAATRGLGRLLSGGDPTESRGREGPGIRYSPMQEAAAFAWIGAFVGLVVVFGFYPSILLYVFCYLRLYARKNARVSAATAFGLLGFLYTVFEVFMGYEIFSGLIAGAPM